MIERTEARFWHFFHKVGIDDGCWEWRASRTRGGYGQYAVDGIMRRAHRVAYELLVAPIPEGLEMDHLCRNRACVRPDHLEPVTRREHQERRTDADLGFIGDWQAAKIQCPKGHPYNDMNTYVHPVTGHRTCKVCRREGMRGKPRH